MVVGVAFSMRRVTAATEAAHSGNPCRVTDHEFDSNHPNGWVEGERPYIDRAAGTCAVYAIGRWVLLFGADVALSQEA